MFQSAANWGAQRGGTIGSAVLNLAAAANAVSEATGINELGRSAGDGDLRGITIALAGFVPAGRALRLVGKVDAVRSFVASPGDWTKIGSFVEAATNRRARGGASVQTIYENADGARVVEHTVVNRAGRAIDGPHPRPDYKPRIDEID